MNSIRSGLLGVLACGLTLLVGASVYAQSLQEVMQQRGLTENDLLAAAKTYHPSGLKDEYVVFSSGGQSGQVIVYGVPSMRILKYIAVFTPEPWQGYGYGEVESMEVLEQGNIDGREIHWGDTHHPALSETGGDYDGEYLFINDKANPRVAVIDLKTFETKQIVVNPLFKSEHGGTFVTPNTEYIIEAAQYPAPYAKEYAPLEEFREKYRGGVTYWKFNRNAELSLASKSLRRLKKEGVPTKGLKKLVYQKFEGETAFLDAIGGKIGAADAKKHREALIRHAVKQGRIMPEQSFSVEMPPYLQDISDAGKGFSYGWSVTNSINTELYIGGYGKGNTKWSNRLANEAGMSAKDTDYMHIVNWQAAEKLFKAGKFRKVNGHALITMKEMVEANALFLLPEPKSPHGADISPDGRYVIVSGKLDTHTTVYDFEKIFSLVEKKDFADIDPWGIPILDMKKAMHTQVNVGLGPLHTQYDSVKGVVYTSLYVDSMVVRWDYLKGKVLGKIPIHYNIGHLLTAEGDTVSPDGKYLVSLNKLAIDRFTQVGPLHPQNHQLIDITEGRPMQLLYDMPLPLGEPHYAQMIKADKLKPVVRFAKKSFANYVKAGKERVERNGNKVTIHSTAIRSHYSPEVIEVRVGDEITWHITNVERAQDQVHGFAVDNYNVHGSLEPGETATFKFVADKEGVFPFYCTEFCSALHLEMTGYLLVKP
ncbi:MAG: cupredoxin domain-containing protein [SAR324 cluster bacterium]|nr:cupredoxin domain-containing protein [SAR324 cluster bacterium]